MNKNCQWCGLVGHTNSSCWLRSQIYYSARDMGPAHLACWKSARDAMNAQTQADAAQASAEARMQVVQAGIAARN